MLLPTALVSVYIYTFTAWGAFLFHTVVFCVFVLIMGWPVSLCSNNQTGLWNTIIMFLWYAGTNWFAAPMWHRRLPRSYCTHKKLLQNSIGFI